MKFLVLFLVTFFHFVSINKTFVEENCKSCTGNQSKIFMKAIWNSNLQPFYSCRDSFALASKFGIIVDHACSLNECNGITSRAFLQPYGAKNFNCRIFFGISKSSKGDHRDHQTIALITYNGQNDHRWSAHLWLG